MPDASALPDCQTGPQFRDFVESDVERIVEMGADFFAESEFPDFAEYSEDNFRQTVNGIVMSPALEGFVFEMDGVIEGFIFYHLECAYTVKPIALMFLFYVTPEFRRSPVGRELLDIAEGHAKACGATVFYAGAMAGIQSANRTLKNLYVKAGYDELYWGRKILKGNEDV